MATTFITEDHRIGTKRKSGRAIDTTPYTEMTLRDYFASQALIAFGQWAMQNTGNREKEAAKLCFRMADVMIMARDDDLTDGQ